jgi:hypothetical protein
MLEKIEFSTEPEGARARIKKTGLSDVFLSFDVEDYINTKSMENLGILLRLLDKYELRGIFFITGTVAEGLHNYPEIQNLLRKHEIGYHSTCHSIRPRIFEYTDTQDYDEAIAVSANIETSHIDPTTSTIQSKKGGIHALREIFKKKEIVAFRAPQLCWSPPHLEGLRKLGINFDFSSDISGAPVCHKGITFYPYPYWIDGISAKIVDIRQFRPYRFKLVTSLLRKRCIVLGLHPHKFSFKSWDHIFFNLNKSRKKSHSVNLAKTRIDFFTLQCIFRLLETTKRRGQINVTPKLGDSMVKLVAEEVDVDRVYKRSLKFPLSVLHYEPRYLLSHFHRFFED